MAKVLVVEDYASLQKIYEKALAIKGHEVDLASDGDEALKAVGTKEYDIILLDILMPKMDGFRFLRAFKTHDHPKTKVVAFSNLASPELFQEAKELGVVKYLPKPSYTPQQVANAIDEILAT